MEGVYSCVGFFRLFIDLVITVYGRGIGMFMWGRRLYALFRCKRFDESRATELLRAPTIRGGKSTLALANRRG